MLSDEEITVTDTNKLCENIASLYLNEKFADVTLILDGMRLPAHKAILSVSCEYFESLLYNGFQESKQNEITIANVQPDTFRKLLKYIYTGTVTMSGNIEPIMDILLLAHQYCFESLESGITSQLKSILNLKNICLIFETANVYCLTDLKQVCYSFMDINAPEIVASNSFNDLSQKSMIALLERDTFWAPEIEIFKGVAKWCKTHNDVDGLVMQCIRFSWLTVPEIISVVRPTKLVDNDTMLQAIAEIVGSKPKTSHSRAVLLRDENLSTFQHQAEVLSGSNKICLLNGNINDNYAHQNIDGKSGFIIKLGSPSNFNNIVMMLSHTASGYYSYYIEASIDQIKWRKIIDYSGYACRSAQDLYFPTHVGQYIKIVGTYNTAGDGLRISFLSISFENNIPKTRNGIVYPKHNVANQVHKAKVIEGSSPDKLIDGDYKNYDDNNGFSDHVIDGEECIVVQLAQPYMISSIRLLLWDKDDRSYRYLIETSVNKHDWEVAVDRRNEDCKSWQNLRFKERIVVFVKITGTHNTMNSDFHCVHFECPSTVGESQLTPNNRKRKITDA